MNCRVCGDEIIVRNSGKNDENFAFCSNCKFVEKIKKVGPELESNEYYRHNNSIENEGYVKYLNNFIDEAVAPFINKGSHLDYGCGPGPVLHELMKRRGFSSKTYDYYCPHDLDYSTKTYDIITSTEVFEHFYDPLENIEKVLKLLKGGGILSIMTSFVKEDDHFFNWWYIRDVTHVSFYHLKTFEYIATKYNLEILYTNYTNIIVLKSKLI